MGQGTLVWASSFLCFGLVPFSAKEVTHTCAARMRMAGAVVGGGQSRRGCTSIGMLSSFSNSLTFMSRLTCALALPSWQHTSVKSRLKKRG